MTILGTKQPSEAYYVEFDFTAYLGDETIDTAVVTAVDQADDSDVTATLTDVGQQRTTATDVYVWVRAGTDGHTYLITVEVTTTPTAEVYELDGQLPVAENPAEAGVVVAAATTSAADALAMLQESGAPYTLSRPTRVDDGSEPWKVTPSDEVETCTLYGILMEPTRGADWNSGPRQEVFVLSTDRQYLVAAAGATLTPRPGDTLTDGDDVMGLVSVIETRDGATPVLWELHVRR